MKKIRKMKSRLNRSQRRIRAKSRCRRRRLAYQERQRQLKPLITRQQSEDFRRQMEEDRIKRDAMRPVTSDKDWDQLMECLFGKPQPYDMLLNATLMQLNVNDPKHLDKEVRDHVDSRLGTEKPSGNFQCPVCGRTWNGSELYQDPMSTAVRWTCGDLTCGANVKKINEEAAKPESGLEITVIAPLDDAERMFENRPADSTSSDSSLMAVLANMQLEKTPFEITQVNPIDETGGLDDIVRKINEDCLREQITKTERLAAIVGIDIASLPFSGVMIEDEEEEDELIDDEEEGKSIDVLQLGTTPPEQFGVGLKPTPERFSVFDKDGKYVPAYKSLEDLSAEVQAEQRRRVQESFYAVTNSMLEQLAEAESQARPRCNECDLERPAVTLDRKFIEAGDMMFEVSPDFELPKPLGMGAMDPHERRKSLARRAVDAVKRVFGL